MNDITYSAETCCSACGSTAKPNGAAQLAVACSLDAHHFKERLASIQALAERSLVASRREPLRLHLTYATEALGEVCEIVAKEADCCSLLEFDLRQAHGQVHLIITAPPSAALAADELFAHFAPYLPRSAA